VDDFKKFEVRMGRMEWTPPEEVIKEINTRKYING
jgi:hypothetical protein